jgi:hypothetical protein
MLRPTSGSNMNEDEQIVDDPRARAQEQKESSLPQLLAQRAQTVDNLLILPPYQSELTLERLHTL